MTLTRILLLSLVFLGLIALPLRAAGEPARMVFLTFRDALSQIADDGHSVRIARQSSAMAHEDVNRARSPLMPQVSVNAGRQYYAYQPASLATGGKIFTSEKDFNSLNIGAYQTLYDFGANSSNLKAARSLEGAASDDARRVRNFAVLEFVTGYFDLLEADRLVSVARDEFSSLASHLKDVMVLWREGVAMKNDLLTVRVKFSFARQRLVALKNQRKIISARLCALLSLDEKTALGLEDPKIDIDVPELSVAMASALSERTELKAFEQSVRAAEFCERAYRASGRPVLFTDGGYSYTENRYQARDDNWFVKLGLKFNVFNGGLTRAESAKEHSHIEQLAEQKKKAEEDIRLEVERAYWDLKTASEKLAASRSAARQADENLRVNRIQYEEGAGTSTAILDAVALRSSAETDLWRSAYERKRAWARLLYAMGRDIGREL